jgi:hypothetical protein
VQTLLQNYVGQGVTGVRFQFGLGGGGYSTPFSDTQGTVSPTWVRNLGYFLADLKAKGVVNVTPTATMADAWSGTLTSKTVNYPSGCGSGNETLNYFPWLPFGLNPGDHNYPDRSLLNQAYSCSPPNPSPQNGGTFWGWTPFFNLFDQILSQAQTAGVTIQEFDLENEVNLMDFTVLGRLIYDNITNTNYFKR